MQSAVVVDPVELTAAWRKLAEKSAGDPVALCACCGEVWQYMGTWHTADGWRHSFRHRHAREHGYGPRGRVSLNVAVSADWMPREMASGVRVIWLEGSAVSASAGDRTVQASR
jgi:hypothetical protein